MNTTPLLNRKAVRDLALRLARETRATRFTRCSPRFIERANTALWLWIAAEIHRHPSKGHTLQ